MHRYFLFILMFISIGAGTLSAIETDANGRTFACKALRGIRADIDKLTAQQVGDSYNNLRKTLTQAHKFWVWMAAVMDVATKKPHSVLQGIHDSLMLEGYVGQKNDLISKTGFTWGKQAMNQTEQAIVKARFSLADKLQTSVAFAPDYVWHAWKESPEAQKVFVSYVNALKDFLPVLVEAKKVVFAKPLQASVNRTNPKPKVCDAAKAAALLATQRLEEKARVQWINDQGIARTTFETSEKNDREVIAADESSARIEIQGSFAAGTAVATQAEQTRLISEAEARAEQERLAAEAKALEQKRKDDEAARVEAEAETAKIAAEKAANVERERLSAELEEQKHVERTSLETAEAEARQAIQNQEATDISVLQVGLAAKEDKLEQSGATADSAASNNGDTSTSSESGSSSANLSPVTEGLSPIRVVDEGAITSPGYSTSKRTPRRRKSSSVAAAGSPVVVVSPLITENGRRTPPSTCRGVPSVTPTKSPSVAVLGVSLNGDDTRTPERCVRVHVPLTPGRSPGGGSSDPTQPLLGNGRRDAGAAASGRPSVRPTPKGSKPAEKQSGCAC